jgi:hypothetical protein
LRNFELDTVAIAQVISGLQVKVLYWSCAVDSLNPSLLHSPATMGGLCSCCSAGKEAAWPRKAGFKTERTITDKVPMVLFWAFVGGMVACILSGYWYGNPKRLTHGSDWEGQVCGFDEAVKDSPFMIFCGSPERVGEFPKYIIEGSTTCVKTCPTNSNSTINCLMPAFHNFSSYKGGSIGTVSNVETLEMTLTQSVTIQQTYPTEEYGGRFCLPSQANPELRALIINGPWGAYYRPMVSIGGLMDAWPILLISACTACLLGWLYVFTLSRCAGPLIFGTMILSTLLMLALGLFFFWAIFIDMNDTTTDYAEFNPIMSVFIGDEAKAYSIITGVIVLLVGAILGALTMSSLTHIDEMVGLIAASCECLDKGCSLRIFPIAQASVFLVIVVFFIFYGLPMVASLGFLDYSEISVNGAGVEGLQRVWKKHWVQHLELWYYLVGVVFILEFYLQVGHYVVSYTVISWYFTKGTDQPVDNNQLVDKAMGRGAGKKMEVRVAGVDANYGLRQGTMVETAAGKMLVVPVGKKGPGLGRNDMVMSNFVKPAIPCAAVTNGCITCLFFHVGSIAIGAPVILCYRPFRLIAQCVTGFLTKTSEPGRGPAYAEDAHTSNVKGCLALLSACLEQVFGKYSKTAFTELCLNGTDDFFTCSDTAFQFLVKAGGSIAHLHGAMLLYEMFGTVFITMFCGWMALILQDKVDIFSDKDSSYYIEDKNASAIAAAIVAFAVAFAWMSMWNQIADVLLYCVAWNRRQFFEGEEKGLNEEEVIEPVKTFCPQSIRSLLPPYELDAHMEHGLHAHGIGQQGAIIAAMEHGAMNAAGPAGSTAAPDYSSMVAGAHTTTMKYLG